jgi:hypothetical protein
MFRKAEHILFADSQSAQMFVTNAKADFLTQRRKGAEAIE